MRKIRKKGEERNSPLRNPSCIVFRFEYNFRFESLACFSHYSSQLDPILFSPSTVPDLINSRCHLPDQALKDIFRLRLCGLEKANNLSNVFNKTAVSGYLRYHLFRILN
jgi:hypothetical protein